MVVLPSGCSTKAIASPPANCVISRGGTFISSTSSTWNKEGIFYINSDGVGLEANLGYKIGAEFGLETVGLGYTDGANGPVLTKQTVAGFATASPMYLGLFGLNPEPVNFTTIGNFSALSYLSSLKAQDAIPSLSWSYTAGAYYRLKAGSPNQLVFGGYDASRFLTNSATFMLNEDTTRDIVVAVQSIFVSGANIATLLTEPIFAFIESTDPNIWLPESACMAFEKAFGLELDNTTNLYLINDTHYTNLLAAEPVVTFRLADSLSGGSTVDITLPFSAFALPATYPAVSKPSYYFPLRKAHNQTQYTLGRTFLQEAYLTVDYERRNFSVSQATFVDGATSIITPIFSPSLTSNITHLTTSSANPPTDHSSGLTPGPIAGIVISVIFLLILCPGAFTWYRRRAAPSPRHAVVADTAAPLPKDAPDNVSEIILRYLQYHFPISHGILKPELDGTSAHDDTTADKAQLDLARVNDMPRFGGSEGGEGGNIPMSHGDVFELPSSDIGFELPSSDHQVYSTDYFARGSKPSSARSTSILRTFGGELESPAVIHELPGSSIHAVVSPSTNVVLPIYSPVSNRSSTALSPLDSGSASPPPAASVSLGSSVVTAARSPLSNVFVTAREDAGEGSETNEKNQHI
jgi:hypothetical protein